MEQLIRELKSSVSSERPDVGKALICVTHIVKQLEKEKVPKFELKNVALEVVEAVLAELPPSAEGASKSLRPLLPGAIDSALSFSSRCLSWLSSLFSPKGAVKPGVVSSVAPVHNLELQGAAVAAGVSAPPVENVGVLIPVTPCDTSCSQAACGCAFDVAQEHEDVSGAVIAAFEERVVVSEQEEMAVSEPVLPIEPPVSPVEPPVSPVEPSVSPVEPPVSPVQPPVSPVVDEPVSSVLPPSEEAPLPSNQESSTDLD